MNETKTVKKKWGHEEWIVNREYCGKRMTLWAGHSCSWHYHKLKDETFFVEDGSMILRWLSLDERQRLLQEGYTEEEIFRTSSYKILGPGESHHVRPGTIHRFEGILPTVFFEFSTHHKDEDSYRIPLAECYCNCPSSGVFL